MVTQRKGCGINHAVNGGFSFACGHCARANEPDMDLGYMAERTVEIASRNKLANFAAGVVEQIDAQATRRDFGLNRLLTDDQYRDMHGNDEHLDAATVGDVGAYLPKSPAFVEGGPRWSDSPLPMLNEAGNPIAYRIPLLPGVQPAPLVKV